MLVGLVALPVLVQGYGVDRFGVLTIAWALIGYFSFFDMGLGRALTQLVADRIGSDAQEDIPGIVSTALLLLWSLGITGTLVVWLLSGWLVEHVLAMPPDLREEASAAFRLLAVSLPFVVVTAGLRGALEAHQRFAAISVMRVILGVGTFIGPVLALFFRKSLIPAVAVLVIIRIIIWFGHRRAVYHAIHPGAIRFWNSRWLRPLFVFGGWMTVTNIIGPCMVYLDRFVIGAKLSVAAVGYYTTSYEIVTKAWVVPSAISGVLFPAIAAQWTTTPDRAARLMERGSLLTFISLFPVLLLAALFAKELLRYWLGQDFAEQGALVLQWLSAGVLINSVGVILFALLQGTGHSDWTAKIHLVELVPYLVVLWLLLSHYGIAGVAAAWFLRVTADASLLAIMIIRLHTAMREPLRQVVILLMTGAGLILSSLFIREIELRVLLSITVMIVFVLFVWYRIFDDSDRARLRGFLIAKRG